MRTSRIVVSIAALAALGACSKGSDARPDDALKNDLALAAQVQPYQPQQFVSPNEQQLAAQAPVQQYAAGYTAQPVRSAPVYRAPARRATTARTASRSSGSSSSSGRSSSGDYGTVSRYPTAPAEPIRHTKRDAGIGAVAGAVIGATTSRDKVKGGIIGAAAGGILGGIIGHTVDVQRP